MGEYDWTSYACRSIVRDGLPLLSYAGDFRSASSKNKLHKKASIVKSKFTIVRDLSLAEKKSHTWLMYYMRNSIYYSYEAAILQYVTTVLEDITYAMDRQDIMLYGEMVFRNERPDIQIIACNGRPVGFIEIKKSLDTIMDEPLLAGEIFDYLKLLKSFYGIELQFGIVSTYVHWRFFWLPETDYAARQDSVPNPQSTSNSGQGQSQLVIQLPDIPCYDKGITQSIQVMRQSPNTQRANKKREVYASDVFAFTDKDLPRAIASILTKMAASPRREINLADSTRSYIWMTETSWNWGKLPPNLQEIKFGNLPQSDTKNFICLAYLGSGIEGVVWLATTEEGIGCVIKLAKSVRLTSPLGNRPKKRLNETQAQKRNDEEAECQKAMDCLIAEANHWKRVWGIDTQVKFIGGQPALVMPYFKMCTHNELEQDPLIKAAVKDAIRLMASKGLRHDDLSRRHVGLYRKNNCLQAVFIDLSCVVEEQEANAIAKMMENLNLT